MVFLYFLSQMFKLFLVPVLVLLFAILIWYNINPKSFDEFLKILKNFHFPEAVGTVLGIVMVVVIFLFFWLVFGLQQSIS